MVNSSREGSPSAPEQAPEEVKQPAPETRFDIPNRESFDKLVDAQRQAVDRSTTTAINDGGRRLQAATATLEVGTDDQTTAKAETHFDEQFDAVQGAIATLGEQTQAEIATASSETEATPPVLPEDQARERWKTLTEEQRLAYCDPATVRREMVESLALQQPANLEGFGEQERFADAVERIRGNVDAQLEGQVREQHISREYAKKISDSVKEYVNLFQQAQAEGGLRADLGAGEVARVVEDIVQKLVYQNKESLRRSLGDHGVRHIIDGNITEAMKMVEVYNAAHPDEQLNALDRLKIMTVHYNHDLGYTVGVARTGFEATGSHPLFSQKLFESEEGRYGKIFSVPDLEHMSGVIKTHDKAETDFSSRNKAVESIVRLSDNLGLFADTKLPEIFYNDPENIAILQKIDIAKRSGQDIRGLRRQLVERVRQQPDLDETTRQALLNAAAEIDERAPKFNFGMFAGQLEGYRMRGGQMIVQLRDSDMHKQIQELFSLGQRQFIKLLESYQINLEDLNTTFDAYVKTEEIDGKLVRYVDLPPTGEGDKVLRFEFLPEDQTKADPRNVELKKRFAETQAEWESKNIRREINALVVEFEKPENRTIQKVESLFDVMQDSITLKVDLQDIQALAELQQRLMDPLSSDADFQKNLEGVKRFLTSQERAFLASE